MIALTAATGQLGRLVVTQLLEQIPANQIVAVVRNPAKAADLAARGVNVRRAGYTDATALEQALVGVDRLLLISSSEIGQRTAQHQNVVAAAKRAGVKLLTYTSLLHADESPLDLASEHVATEQAIKASGLPHIILRNGWYTENYTASVSPAVANGAFLGSAGDGRISLAARADYAAAAVAALTGQAETGRTYELAGDTAVTLAELAAEISRQTGKTFPYRNLPVAEYAAILLKIGLPPALAHGLAHWDDEAARGALFDDGRELSRLIGRPTTPLAESVRQALKS
ncbi:SDR family oxidoreductase [Oleiharenicola lentus]|jgi:NAD(P)H dehydrogenase (quinone)|uniref:SDR family oxidoreductase n=1 Tax=Oleiharenicola lentus TaxID=2508720 RepID=A0A4Q1C5R9_9BACT|nr:SDR family oxidoreductase [Oleiharenicola lentus]RXK53771.1 SDR family oxidoreductase [Oleiharenicola lentus]